MALTTKGTYKVGNGLGSKTTVINVALTSWTEANLESIVKFLESANWTIAGIDSTSANAIQIALQGNEFTVDGSDFAGVSGAVDSVLAVFE